MRYAGKTVYPVIVLVLAAIWPGAGARGGLVIDNFSDAGDPNPWPISLTTPPAVQTVVEGGLTGVLGGTRLTSLSAFFFDNVGLDEVQVNIVPSFGVLDYSSSIGANGDLLIAYVGRFNADLTGDALIQIDFAGFDLAGGSAMPVAVTLGNGSTTASLTRTLSAPGQQSLEFNLLDFQGINQIDLGSVNGLLVEFDPGPGADFRVNGISSVVPEPPTLLILLAGAATVLRRFRRHT